MFRYRDDGTIKRPFPAGVGVLMLKLISAMDIVVSVLISRVEIGYFYLYSLFQDMVCYPSGFSSILPFGQSSSQLRTFRTN